MKFPKITIGMPVYNGDQFIKTAIDSVLTQKFSDFELIISNNASTDNTDKICKEYKLKDKRIRYLCQKSNRGGVKNYKTVLDAAKGKYFMWLAADDLFQDSNYLKFVVDEISPKYDFYFTNLSLINQRGDIVKSNIHEKFKNCKTKFDFLKQSLYNNSFQLYSLFNKIQLLEDFKYLEKCKNYKSFNEGLFVHVISVKRKAKYVQKTNLLFRIHKDSWSNKRKIHELIFDHINYSLRTIQLIIKLSDLLFIQKVKLLSIELYISFKNLIYFSLASIWQICRLKQIPLLNSIKYLIIKKNR